MLSLLVRRKVIVLSGFYCICGFNFSWGAKWVKIANAKGKHTHLCIKRDLKGGFGIRGSEFLRNGTPANSKLV